REQPPGFALVLCHIAAQIEHLRRPRDSEPLQRTPARGSPIHPDHAHLAAAGESDRRAKERVANPVVRVVPHAVDQHGALESGLGTGHEAGQHRFAVSTPPGRLADAVEPRRGEQLRGGHATPDETPPLAQKSLHPPPRRVRLHQSIRSKPGLRESSFWVLKTCAVWSPPSEFTLSKAE